MQATNDFLTDSELDPHQLSTSLSVSDPQTLLARIADLERVQAELERKRYVDTSLTHFTELMRWRGDVDLGAWAEAFLRELVPFVTGLHASLYLAQEEQAEQYLSLLATYAGSTTTAQRIAWGQGLTGEAARSASPIMIADAGPLHIQTHSALAQVTATSLLIQPLVYNGNVEGVLEIASVSALDTSQQELLTRICQIMAANLNTVRNQLRIHQLYQAEQAQREVLVAQDEAMRLNLEKLEAAQEQMQRVQKELEQRQETFQQLSDNVPGMIFQMVEDGSGFRRFTFVSKGGEEVFGLPTSELLADSRKAIAGFTPENKIRYHEELKRAGGEMRLLAYESPTTLPDGRQTIVRVTAQPTRGADGEMIWNGYVQDISEQRAFQHQLAAQYEILQRQQQETEHIQAELNRQHELQIIRFERQQAALSAVANSEVLTAGDAVAGMQIIVKTLSETLEIKQVGIWLYSNTGTQESIVSKVVYNQDTDCFSSGLELMATDFPSYFRAIGGGDILCVNDALNDENVREFDGYFRQFGIGAMLDVPLRRRGKLLGVICAEHIGPARQWQTDEQAFLSTMAELVSMAMEAAERKTLEAELEQYRTTAAAAA